LKKRHACVAAAICNAQHPTSHTRRISALLADDNHYCSSNTAGLRNWLSCDAIHLQVKLDPRSRLSDSRP
jgi:hypothetical protein